MLFRLNSYKKNLKAYALFLSVFAVAIVIYLFKLNHALFYFINSLHTLLPDIVWYYLNLISYSKLFILPILLLGITFIWRRDKIFRIIFLIIAYYLLFAGLKILFAEPRPYIVLPANSFFWLKQYEDVLKSAYKSFPSGHAANMAVFVFAINNMFNKYWLKYLLGLLLILTCLSRICTGWHWPLDVIASGLIAYLLVQICLRYNYK